MEILRNLRHKPVRSPDPVRTLETYYPQLLKWAVTLTRGQVAIAQDIVQELCLHFALAKPDLSQVSNIDGYLYTCLRNIYLSAMTKATREAGQLVSVADFDTMQFALSNHSFEGLLQRQNDIRRICAYSIWRKESTKSASYLILLFLHGYTRRQTAEIACVPVSAIYNKLLNVRVEVKDYLERAGRIRIREGNLPPDPELKRSAVSSLELFVELRTSIFAARLTDCLSEEAFLAHYEAARPAPISCTLLAHIVSCERCLTLLETRFQWEDGGNEVEDEANENIPQTIVSYRDMMRRVGSQMRRVYDHRPQTLSIAVNGRIVASHDIRSKQSSLSSRIDQTDTAQFIEVYTEQHVRLALIPVDLHPPEGHSIRVQRVELSDDRWLELTVRIDGLGLQSEATYFDPTLALLSLDTEPEDAPEPLEYLPSSVSPRSRRRGNVARWLEPIYAWARAGWVRALTIQRSAWATALLVFLGLTLWFAYRFSTPLMNAEHVLASSVQVETAEMNGKIEHEVIVLQETATEGNSLAATVESWTDPANGRTMRRLFDAQHRLIAARWRGKDGSDGSYIAKDLATAEDRILVSSAFWAEDVSARGFQALGAEQVQARPVAGGYELIETGFTSGRPHLESATLVLDPHYRIQSEILRLGGERGVTEVRFMQVNREGRSASLVPDSVFDPVGFAEQPAGNGSLSAPTGSQIHRQAIVPDARLLELQIAVLHRLGQIGADTAEPIEVSPTSDGRIRVAGTLADGARREQIRSALESLPGHQLVDVQLSLQRDLRMSLPAARAIKPDVGNIYTVSQGAAPADALLQRQFTAQGLSGERLNKAVAQFSHEAPAHAQAALQHAYALNRLGSSFTQSDLQSLSPQARHMWTDMAARHASILESELRLLGDQLAQIEPSPSPEPDDIAVIPVRNASDFARASTELLAQAQKLNGAMGDAFVAGAAGKAPGDPEALVSAAARAIPLRAAREIAAFAFRLESADNGVQASKSVTQPRSPKQ